MHVAPGRTLHGRLPSMKMLRFGLLALTGLLVLFGMVAASYLQAPFAANAPMQDVALAQSAPASP